MMLDHLLQAVLLAWIAGVGAEPRSVEGRPIPVVVRGNGPDTVLFMGAMHGDEPQGQTLVARLVAEVDRRPELLAGRRLVAMPLVNPDGLRRGTRTNARGVDLNRNFPSRDWSPGSPGRFFPGPYPGSEPETQALMAVIAGYQPGRIVNIHAPLALVNYDGPPLAADLAHAMARACRCPTQADIGYPTPGSFGTYFGGEQGLPVVTLETGEEPASDLWPRYGQALLAAVAYPAAD